MIEQAREPFNPLHKPGCVLHSELPQHPWIELKAILEEWQQHNAAEPDPA